MTRVILEGTNLVEDLDMSEGFSVLTIYERPIDFPEQYVVRESTVLNGRVYLHVDFQLASTLEEARRVIPPGRFCLGEPNDLRIPAVESWI
jgi:hypothetical protein